MSDIVQRAVLTEFLFWRLNMYRLKRVLAGSAVLFALVAFANAGEECPVSTALDRLPKLTYKVGDETTCCSETAAKLAAEKDVAIQFVVADKTFECENEANLALVEATEKFVAAFATPCKCEASGHVAVAGKEVCCDAAAAEVAKLAKKAMDDVKLTYLVGEESVCCPDAAKTLAANTGKPVILCVGTDKTPCEITARLNLARAKYLAAVQALAAHEQQAEEKPKS
jgi:hypothetical protein